MGAIFAPGGARPGPGGVVSSCAMTSLPAGDRPADALGTAAPLVSRTVPLDPELGAALLGLVPSGGARDVCSWVRRGEGVVAWGRAAGRTASGPGRIAELDLADVPPTSHALDLVNVFGEDIPREPWPREQLVELAPERTADGFLVPPIGA